jgi:hypothetical protein
MLFDINSIKMEEEKEKFNIKTEHMFMVVIGTKQIMETIVSELNNKNKNDTYVLSQILVPTVYTGIELMKKLNNVSDDLINSTTQKPVLINDGVEYAQAHICAHDSYDNDNYMLQILSDNESYYVLSFLKFILSEDDDPENIVDNWFTTNIKKNYTIKKATKMITVAGNNADILVIGVDVKKITLE